MQRRTFDQFRVLYLSVASAASFFIAASTPCQSAQLSFTFDDVAGDPRDKIDVTQIHLQFDNGTGDFVVKATADPANPFHGSHLLYLSVFNPDVGTTESSRSMFSVSRFGFVANSPTTMVSRTGTSPVLTHWKAGDRVASYDVFGRPDGAPPGFQSVLGGNTQSFNNSDEIRDVAVIDAIPEPTTAPLLFAAASLCLTRRSRSGRRIKPLPIV
jgi:hypothetical protein